MPLVAGADLWGVLVYDELPLEHYTRVVACLNAHGFFLGNVASTQVVGEDPLMPIAELAPGDIGAEVHYPCANIWGDLRGTLWHQRVRLGVELDKQAKVMVLSVQDSILWTDASDPTSLIPEPLFEFARLCEAVCSLRTPAYSWIQTEGGLASDFAIGKMNGKDHPIGRAGFSDQEVQVLFAWYRDDYSNRWNATSFKE